jgi:hypothetical protein
MVKYVVRLHPEEREQLLTLVHTGCAAVERELYDYLQCGILAPAFCGLAVTPATKSCCCPSVTSGGGFARRVQGGAWPRRPRTWLSGSFPGSPPANGSCRYPSLALLDGFLAGPDGDGPYDYSYHDRPVLRAPGGHTRCPTGPGPTGIGHRYPTLWQRHQSQSPFRPHLP